MTERDPYPSETQDRFIVRLPDGMRDRIKAAAEANNRSMNAEVVAALEQAFLPPEALLIKVMDLVSQLDAEDKEERQLMLMTANMLVRGNPQNLQAMVGVLKSYIEHR